MGDELTEVLEDYAERWPDLTEAERIAALGLAVRVVVRLDRRAGALVLEDVGDDGETVIRARRAKVGLDPVFVIGAIVTAFTAGIAPIVVAALA